jgi:hypothetical protein
MNNDSDETIARCKLRDIIRKMKYWSAQAAHKNPTNAVLALHSLVCDLEELERVYRCVDLADD